jgi:hypothetical protein
VWRAAGLASGQDVAVKVLDAFPAADTAAQARFRLVAQTVAQLSAPGLAEVREFGEAELDGGRTVLTWSATWSAGRPWMSGQLS